MATNKKPVIAITMGDFNGIGPEVVLKTALSTSVRKIAVPVLIGSIDVYEYYTKLLNFQVLLKEIDSVPKQNQNFVPILPVRKFVKPIIKPGELSFEAGRLATESVIAAAGLCLMREVQGMVTAPISKEAMNFNKFSFPGQTELLAELCGSKRFAMFLTYNNFRVGLATIHLPLRNVANTITKKLISDKINILNDSLKKDFGLISPKIAVLGLNPHAGENGLLGKEEIKTILPSIKLAKHRKIKVEGPFSADGFFGSGMYKYFDAVLAMYHDQGLIPLKLLGFEKGVNFTAGLPVVRTSPDHGTAYDIAGKGTANPSSIIEAVRLAVKIIKNRNHHMFKKTVRNK